MLKVRFSKKLSEEDLADFKVVDFSGLDATLELNLEHQEIKAALQTVFNALPVKDMTIEDINVEEVIKELYRSKEN